MLEGDFVSSSIGDDLRSEIDPQDKISSHTAGALSLGYAISFTDPNVRNFYAGAYQGLGVSVMGFGNTTGACHERASKYIGMPVTVYALQGAPFLKFRRAVSIGYEWQFGASFGWKPFSMPNENFNLTVGSHVNAYLNLGFYFHWQVAERIDLDAGVSLTHFSNGNTSWPNPGVNMGGIRLGVSYRLGEYNEIYEKSSIEKEEGTTVRKIGYNISLWGSLRKRVYRGEDKPILLKGHFAIGGVNFSPMWSLGRHWGLGPSADLEWDESSNLKKYYVSGESTDNMKFYRPPFFSQVAFGVSAHGELRMPVFTLNLGFGYNVIAPEENRGTYQNITLKTYLIDCLYLNVGYQLRNFYRQSSLMLGLGVTL